MTTAWAKLRWAAYLWAVIILIGLALTPTFGRKLQVRPRQVLPAPFELSSLPPYPVAKLPTNLKISSDTFASLDVASGEYLLGHNVTRHVPPASTSKLMLAWLVRKQCPLEQVISVRSDFGLGTVLGLRLGQAFTTRELLYAALLPSANDAATALAEGCLGSVEVAVRLMNDRAGAWHLKDTHFTNPTGLDQENNYTSSADLARLASLVTQDQEIAKITSTRSYTIRSQDGTSSFSFDNTNKLLGLVGVDGIKTGSTELARQNLILSSNFAGHRIISVVLGSEDRYGDSLNLLGELRRIYRWEVDGDRDFGATLGISDTAK